MAAAIALFRNNRYREARAAFKTITAAEPKNAEALFYLGWTAFRLHQPEESVKLLEQATRLNSTNSLYFHVLGDAYGESALRASVFRKAGLANKCLAAYDKGIAVNPDNVEIRVARCNYYREVPALFGGGVDKAFADAGEIRKRDPIIGTPLLVDLYVKEKRYDKGFALLEGLIREHPESRFYPFQLGRLGAISGQHLDAAEVALRGYLDSNPAGNEPPLYLAHWYLGRILEKSGNRSGASAEYETALRCRPEFAPVVDGLKRLSNSLREKRVNPAETPRGE